MQFNILILAVFITVIDATPSRNFASDFLSSGDNKTNHLTVTERVNILEKDAIYGDRYLRRLARKLAFEMAKLDEWKNALKPAEISSKSNPLIRKLNELEYETEIMDHNVKEMGEKYIALSVRIDTLERATSVKPTTQTKPTKLTITKSILKIISKLESKSKATKKMVQKISMWIGEALHLMNKLKFKVSFTKMNIREEAKKGERFMKSLRRKLTTALKNRLPLIESESEVGLDGRIKFLQKEGKWRDEFLINLTNNLSYAFRIIRATTVKPTTQTKPTKLKITKRILKEISKLESKSKATKKIKRKISMWKREGNYTKQVTLTEEILQQKL